MLDGFVAMVLHHAEAIDPDLVDWIRHQIDAVFGIDALAIVILLAVLIVALPLGIAWAAVRQRRAHRSMHERGERERSAN